MITAAISGLTLQFDATYLSREDPREIASLLATAVRRINRHLESGPLAAKLTGRIVLDNVEFADTERTRH